ncbi:MAG: DUF424 family protein [archaeon]
MFVNIIKSYRDIVAICDSKLIGKVFEEGNFKLEVKENFFKGKEVSEKELIKIMGSMSREDATFNIVGEESTRFALEEGLIDKECIKTIQGIPFALVLI